MKTKTKSQTTCAATTRTRLTKRASHRAPIYFAALFCFLLLGSIASAQNVNVSGSTGADGTYSTLSAAFAAINASAQTGNTIAVNVVASTSEGAATSLLNNKGWTSLTVTPTGAVSVSGATTSPNPLIDLNGANNVVIDGLNTGGNSLSIVNTTVGGGSTIRFIADASSNTVKNCTIAGAGNVVTTGTIVFSTGTTTGNLSNTIQGNTITFVTGPLFPVNAIYSLGTSAAIPNTATITGNNIQDYFSATLVTAGINLAATGNTGWTITNNKLFQTATRVYTAAQTHSGINVGTGSGYTISGNTIGFADANGNGTTNIVGNSVALTGTFPSSYTTTGTANATRYVAINCAFTAGGAASSIQNNTIGGFALYTSSGASTTNGILCGINVTSGNANIGTTTGNTIGATTGGGGASAAALYAANTGGGGAVVGIYATSTNTVTIQNNTIGLADSVGTTSTLSGAFTGIDTAGTGGVFNISSNIIGNSTADNIRTGYTLSGGNLSNAGTLTSTTGTTSPMVGIRNSATGALTISSNTLRGWVNGTTGGGALTGITATAANATSVAINSNALGTSGLGWMRYAFLNSGTITGINVTGPAAAATLSVSSNDFRGITYSVSGTGTHTYITWTHGNSVTDTVNLNTFTNLNVNTTGGINFLNRGPTSMTATGVTNITNNSIVTGFNKGVAGLAVTFLNTGGGDSSPAGAVLTETGNNFSNITLTGATTVAGWSDQNGPSGSGVSKNISSNTFSNISTGSASVTIIAQNFGSPTTVSNNTISNVTHAPTVTALTLTGISIGSGSGGATDAVASNAISGLSSTGTGGQVIGILGGSTSITTFNINNNTVSNISSTSTAGPVVAGIFGNATGTTTNIFKNKVYDVVCSPGAVIGINSTATTAGNTINVYNNIVGRLYASTSAFFQAARGLLLQGTVAANFNVFYNTVYLDGTTPTQTYCVYIGSTTANLPNVNAIDNIFVNNVASNNGATLPQAAYFRFGTTNSTNLASTTNNNLLYAGTPAVDHLIYVDGAVGALTNPKQMLSDYKSFVASRENMSSTELPPFLNTTNGALANYLHLDTTIATQAESGGIPITSPFSITDDYDNDARNASTPDVGADEFNGIAIDVNPPSISYSALSNTNLTGNRTLTATITDATGVPTAGAGLPVLYWRINAGAYTPATAMSLGGNQYQFTFGAGVTTADVVSYYVVAQDTVTPTPNVGAFPSAGASGFSANPPAASVPPTTPSSYTILNSLSGDYTVGSGGNYSSLTGANGAITGPNGLNNSVVTGPVRFLLTDAMFNGPEATETYPITIGPLTGTNSTNTVTIKPQVGNSPVMSASNATTIFDLSGASWVIIDGSNTVAGTTKDLTIANTNTSGAVVRFINGANNNTIKNCVLKGVSTSTANGTVFFSTVAAGATGNSNNRIENNDIRDGATAPAYGIYNLGSSSPKNANNVITLNRIFNFQTNGIRDDGNSVTVTYSLNEIFEQTAQTTAVVGFRPSATNIDGFTFTRNYIHDLNTTSTGSIYGIHLFDTSTVNTSEISNNMIALSPTAPLTLRGIYDQTATGEKYNVYANSVFLGGAVTGASNSEAYYWSIASTTNARDNILVNARTGGTGKHYAYRTNTTLANLTSDYNDIYNTGGTGNVFGNDGTADRADLNAWRTNTGKDLSSVSGDPQFRSTTDLHILRTNPAVLSPVENIGIAIGAITTDFDGDTRATGAAPNGPDIGADEVTTMQFSVAAYQVAENDGGGGAVITVTRTAGSANAATINYSTSDGSATGGASCGGGTDYVNTSGTLSFAAGETSKNFNIPICNDSIYEGNETVNLTLSTPAGGSIQGAPATAVLTILDDDPAPTVQFDSATYSVNENAGMVTITVTKTGNTAVSAMVNYATSNGSATQPGDYTMTSGTLTFGPNDTSMSFDVPITDDGTYENSEDFTVTLSSPSGATLGSPSSATVTINDDDAPPVIQFSASNYNAGEGAGTVTITLTKTGSTALVSSVQVATSDGSATAPDDYNALPGGYTVAFAPNDTIRTFQITINEDSVYEGDEQFNVALSGPVNATIGAQNPATVTIQDNDSAPSFSINDVTQAETNSGQTAFVFTVTKTGATALSSSVTYETMNDTATAPSDFTAIAPTVLTFGPADTTMQVTVMVNGDTTPEPNETFFVNLSNPTGATISDAQGVGTITNDDGGPAIVYVDDDWASVPCGQDPDGAGPATSFCFDSFATIEDAVNGVGAFGPVSGGKQPATGSTVIVYAGNYVLGSNVNINKSMSIQGPNLGITPRSGGGSRVAEAVVNGNGGPINGSSGKTFVITTPATAVTISGFKFTNFDGNVIAEAGGAALTNVDLHQNIFDTNNGGLMYKFNLATATAVSFTDNKVANQTMTGINTALLFMGKLTNSHFDDNEVSNIASRELINLYDTITNSTISANSLTNTAGLALLAANQSGVTFDGNTITSTTTAAGVGAIYVSSNDGRTISNLMITNNNITTVTGGGIGVRVSTDTATAASINGVTITGNTISGTSTYGLDLDTFANTGTGTITNVDVINNNFVDNAFGPMLVYARPTSGNNVISNLTLANNTFTENAAIFGASFVQIDLRNVSGTNFINGNTYTLSGVLPGGTTSLQAIGIRGNKTGSFNITNNDLNGGGVLHNGAATVFQSGIRIFSNDATTGALPAAAVIDAHNNFIRNWEDGVVVRDGVAAAYGGLAAGITVKFNNDDLSANSLKAIRSGTPGELVDASVSWWGTNTQAGVQGATTAGVDFTPYLNSGTDTSGSAGFQGDFSVLDVTTLGAQVGLTGRVQEGINLLTSGGTLNVHSGSYTGGADATANSVILSAGASPGQVTITGNVLLDGNDTVPIEINGTNAATDYDNFIVNGTVTLGGATLSLSGTHSPTPGQVFRIIDNDSNDAVSGTFAGLPEGATIPNFLGSVYDAKITYVGGDGNDVEIVVQALPSFSISDVMMAEGDSGQTMFTFTVTKTGSASFTSMVDFMTQDGSATAPSDYTATNGALTFGPADTTMQVTVLVNGDTTYETNETFKVHLLNPVSATISNADGTGTIVNDDNPPSFSIDDVTMAEGDSGTTMFTFTVTKTGATEVNANVMFATMDGSATLVDNDYQMITGGLSFLPNETAKPITVLVNGDTNVEPNETFTVELSNPVNASINNGTGTGTIVNDDAAASFSINDVTQTETNSGQTAFTFTVTKTGSSGASVDFQTMNGTATAPSDYTATNGTLTFGPTDTTMPVTVLVNGDTTPEPNETFTVHLSNPTNGAVITNADGLGTIVNDDGGPAIVYVDDDWVGTPYGADPDGGGPATSFGFDSFATIGDGVNGVANPGTVIVRPGNYTGNVSTIKTLSLRGARYGVDARGRVVGAPNPAVESVWSPTTAGTGTLILNATTTATEVDGFAFTGGTSLGVIQTQSGTDYSNLRIANNFFSGYSQSAVFMNRGGNNITIDRNVMDGSNISGSGQAIFGNGPQNFNGLWITNNNIVNNANRYGFFVDGNHNMAESATRAAKIDGNLFDNNLQGLNLGSRSMGTLGAPVLGTYAGTIANNTFSNNAANGIQAGVQHVLVSGNTFSNNAIDGLALTSFGNTGADRGAQNSDIKSNTFTGNLRSGLFFSGTQGTGLIETNHANFNRFIGNAVAIQYGSSVAAGNNATIDVENNWFGCNFGPGAGGTGCSGTTNGTLVFAGNTGVLDSSPWIVLGVSASPNPIAPGGNSTVTADMTHNSDNAVPSMTMFVPQVGVAFSATQGTIAPPSGTIANGQAMSTFTSTSNNDGTASSTVDGQTVTTVINVTSPTFSIDDVMQAETNSGQTMFVFTVTKTGSTPFTSTVDFQTQDGTAMVSDNDYVMNSGTLTFGPTDTMMQITVLVNGDTKYEADETFTVELSNPTVAGESIAGGVVATGLGTILNDDPQPSFSIDDVTMNEGDSGTTMFVFTVTKTGATAFSSSVNFQTMDGSATTADNDYQPTMGMLNFGPTDTMMQITVLVNGDTTFEPDETFTVHLSGATNATISDADGTGTITNDDRPLPPIVYVDDDWSAVPCGQDPDMGGPATEMCYDAFATIQGGVNGVANPGTVIVYAGTYPEAVTVNKSLNMMGAKAGQDANTRFAAFVSGPNGPKADPAVESILTAAATAPTSGANDTLHVVANNVTFNGFVVDGNNPSLPQGGAIVIGGINTDSRTGIQTEDAAGNNFSANNVLIEYNIVQNFAGDNANNLGGGITLVNPTDTSPATTGGLITGNLVRNFGAYGILLSNNAYGGVTFNTVDTPDYPTANAGIWVYDFPNNGVGPKTINIANNNVTVRQDNFGGIWINLVYAPLATINLDNNTVNAAAGVQPLDDFTYGIYLTSLLNGTAAHLSGNTVGSAGGTFDRGIALWNVGTSPTATVKDGSVKRSVVGISLVDNDANFGHAGSSSAANVSGMTVSESQVGVTVDATASGASTVTMTVTNSTLSGNTAANGGGITSTGTGGVASTTVTNSTLSGNSPSGASVLLQDASLTTGNTIFNTGGSGTNISALGTSTVASRGFNLSSDGFGGFLNNTGDQVNTDPMLGPLKDNGGPTFTHAPLIDSPAIDQGKDIGPIGPTYTATGKDQRGFTRPVNDPAVPNAVGGDGSDIGAVELTPGVHPSSAASRKTHGAAGDFDVSLPLTGPVGIECRGTGAPTNLYQMVLIFENPVTFSGAAVTSGTGTVDSVMVSSIIREGVSGTQVTINLSGVTDVQTLTVGLFDVDDGVNMGDVGVRMRVMIGDATGNGAVNSSDVGFIKGKLGDVVNGTTFRADVTANGDINSSDVTLTKSKIP